MKNKTLLFLPFPEGNAARADEPQHRFRYRDLCRQQWLAGRIWSRCKKTFFSLPEAVILSEVPFLFGKGCWIIKCDNSYYTKKELYTEYTYAKILTKLRRGVFGQKNGYIHDESEGVHSRCPAERLP